YEKMRQAWRESPNSPLSDLFAFAPIYDITIAAGDRAELVKGQAVSGGYFARLRLRPLLGRGITQADDAPAASPAVVLSYEYWKDHLGADAAIVGKPLKLNQTTFTVVGVSPADFHSTLQVDYRPDIAVPIRFEPTLLGERTGMPREGKPGIWWLNVMGRLKPGATREQAAASLNGTFQAAALEIMPPPRRDTDVARLEPKDYPRLAGQPGA